MFVNGCGLHRWSPCPAPHRTWQREEHEEAPLEISEGGMTLVTDTRVQDTNTGIKISRETVLAGAHYRNGGNVETPCLR